MASIIKNQILKHLSKFVKGLSPDQISVEVLRGRGELNNLELDEKLLTEVLELPTWLSIKHAKCSRVAVKIPWTKLKSMPLKIYIDEIKVEVVLSSNLRDIAKESASAASSDWYSSLSGGDVYGYANRVAEGMSIYMNSLEVNFTSEVFRGSIMLQRLSVESRCPTWSKADNLRQTRVKNASGQEVLIFKEIEWEILRIEASAIEDCPTNNTMINAPLRLITSHGKSRVVCKKSTLDGSVLSARLMLLLDNILWVMTLPQVRSAIAFYRYIMSLIERASHQSKSQKAENQIKLQTTSNKPPNVKRTSASNTPTHQSNPPANAMQKIFNKYDVPETSYHFYAGSVEIHMYDEGKTSDIVFPENWNIENGGIQIDFKRLSCDMYPYHLAAGSRDYWLHYKETKVKQWIEELLKHYRRQAESKLDSADAEKLFAEFWPKLLSQCVVIRIENLTVCCVYTPDMPQKDAAKRLIMSDMSSFKLPADMPLIHIELGEYYLPSDDLNLPAPPRSTYVQLNPIRFYVDMTTFRWINYIYLDVCNRLGLKPDSLESALHGDIRVQALMPRIIVPSGIVEVVHRDKKPQELHIQCSNALVTNCSIGLPGDRRYCQPDSLKQNLGHLMTKPLFSEPTCVLNAAPGIAKSLGPLPLNTHALKQYFTDLCDLYDQPDSDSVRMRPRSSFSGPGGRPVGPQKSYRGIFDRLASDDLWTISANPVWAEFHGSPKYYPKPMPFLLDCSMTLFALNSNISASSSGGATLSVDKDTTGVPPAMQADKSVPVPSCADSYIIFSTQSVLKIALDHYQYLYFVHTMEYIAKSVDLLSEDIQAFSNFPQPKSMALSLIAPWVELSMILPKDAPISPYDQQAGCSTGILGLVDGIASLGAGDRLDEAITPEDPLQTRFDDDPLIANLRVARDMFPKIGVSPRGSTLNLSQSTANTPGAVPSQSSSAVLSLSLGPAHLRSDSSPTLSHHLGAGSNAAMHRIQTMPASSFQSGLDSIGTAETSSNMGDDTMSIMTDYSDDERQFVIIDAVGEMGPFEEMGSRQRKSLVVDDADEAVGLDSGRNSPSGVAAAANVASMEAEKRLSEEIALITVKMADLEVFTCSFGQDGRTYIQSPHIDIKESGPIPLSQLHDAIAGKTVLPTKEATLEECRYASSDAYPVRIEMGKTATLPDGYLSGSMKGIELTLNNTNMANLGGFLQDDRPQPSAMPIHIDVFDSAIAITDPKVPDPFNMVVKRAILTQGSGGMLGVDRNSSKTEFDEVIILRQENQALRRKLMEAKELVQKLAKQQYNMQL